MPTVIEVEVSAGIDVLVRVNDSAIDLLGSTHPHEIVGAPLTSRPR